MMNTKLYETIPLIISPDQKSTELLRNEYNLNNLWIPYPDVQINLSTQKLPIDGVVLSNYNELITNKYNLCNNYELFNLINIDNEINELRKKKSIIQAELLLNKEDKKLESEFQLADNKLLILNKYITQIYNNNPMYNNTGSFLEESKTLENLKQLQVKINNIDGQMVALEKNEDKTKLPKSKEWTELNEQLKKLNIERKSEFIKINLTMVNKYKSISQYVYCMLIRYPIHKHLIVNTLKQEEIPKKYNEAKKVEIKNIIKTSLEQGYSELLNTNSIFSNKLINIDVKKIKYETKNKKLLNIYNTEIIQNILTKLYHKNIDNIAAHNHMKLIKEYYIIKHNLINITDKILTNSLSVSDKTRLKMTNTGLIDLYKLLNNNMIYIPQTIINTFTRVIKYLININLLCNNSIDILYDIIDKNVNLSITDTTIKNTRFFKFCISQKMYPNINFLYNYNTEIIHNLFETQYFKFDNIKQLVYIYYIVNQHSLSSPELQQSFIKCLQSNSMDVKLLPSYEKKLINIVPQEEFKTTFNLISLMKQVSQICDSFIRNDTYKSQFISEQITKNLEFKFTFPEKKEIKVKHKNITELSKKIVLHDIHTEIKNKIQKIDKIKANINNLDKQTKNINISEDSTKENIISELFKDDKIKKNAIDKLTIEKNKLINELRSLNLKFKNIKEKKSNSIVNEDANNILSPNYNSNITINGFEFPTITHYVYYNLFQYYKFSIPDKDDAYKLLFKQVELTIGDKITFKKTSYKIEGVEHKLDGKKLIKYYKISLMEQPIKTELLAPDFKRGKIKKKIKYHRSKRQVLIPSSSIIEASKNIYISLPELHQVFHNIEWITKKSLLYVSLYYKFNNSKFKDVLLKTGNKELLYIDNYDYIIGYNPKSPNIKGNLTGLILMKIREDLKLQKRLPEAVTQMYGDAGLTSISSPQERGRLLYIKTMKSELLNKQNIDERQPLTQEQVKKIYEDWENLSIENKKLYIDAAQNIIKQKGIKEKELEKLQQQVKAHVYRIDKARKDSRQKAKKKEYKKVDLSVIEKQMKEAKSKPKKSKPKKSKIWTPIKKNTNING